MKIVNKILLKKNEKKSKLLLLVCLNIAHKLIQGIDNRLVINNKIIIKYIKKNFTIKDINNLEIKILKILDYKLYEFMIIDDNIFNDYDNYIKNILFNKNILKNNFKIKQYINNEYIKIKYNIL